MSALPLDDLPSLRYFLLGHSNWPNDAIESRRLFATFGEAMAAAASLAEGGRYSDFSVYAIERGQLRRVSSAYVRYGAGRIALDWTAEPELRRLH